MQALLDDLHKECGFSVNNEEDGREIFMRYVDLVIRKTADNLCASDDPKARPTFRPCFGDGYAHELASRIADQKKKKNQEKETRKKKTKQENKLRTRVDTPETDRPDNSTFGDEVLSAPMVDQEFGVVLCDVSSGSGVFDRISEAHGDELMLRALDLRKRGHPDKASYLLQLLMDIVQVESAGQNRQNRWLTQDDSRRDRAQEHINRCALDDLAKIYKECASSSTAKSSSAPESLPYKSYV